MINPTTKAKLVSLTTVAAQILAAPAPFRFDLWAQNNLTFAQANATYGVSQTEYNWLFVPDVASIGPINSRMLGLGPTLTTSTAKEIADRINKFVANVQSEF